MIVDVVSQPFLPGHRRVSTTEASAIVFRHDYDGDDDDDDPAYGQNDDYDDDDDDDAVLQASLCCRPNHHASFYAY